MKNLINRFFDTVLLLTVLVLSSFMVYPESKETTAFELRQDIKGDVIHFNVYYRGENSPWKFILTLFTREKKEIKEHPLTRLGIEKGIMKNNTLGLILSSHADGSKYKVYFREKNGKWKFKNSISVIDGPVGIPGPKTFTKVEKIIFNHPHLLQINWGTYSIKTKKLRRRSSSVFHNISENNKFVKLHYMRSWKIRKHILDSTHDETI